MKSRLLITLLFVVLALVLAACRQAQDGSETASNAETVVVDTEEESVDGDANIAVVEKFHEALNAYDAAAVEALVTDDFSLHIVYGYGEEPLQIVPGGEGLTDPFVDRAALAGMVGEGLPADNWQMQVSNLRADAGMVSGDYSGAGDYLRSLGIGEEYGSVEAEVAGGLLRSITYTNSPVFTLAAAVAEQRQAEAANLEIVRRFYEEYSAGNADVILEVHPETIVMHYLGSAEEVPAQVLRDDLAALKDANPDLHAEIHDMRASGDLVITELTWKATHTGDYFGFPASGRSLEHPGIVARRIENGLIVESWEMWDDLTFTNAMGLTGSWDDLVAGATAADAAAEPELPGKYRVLLDEGLGGDVSAGYYRVNLTEDGRYQISFTEDELALGALGVDGSYALDGGQITFVDESGFAACPPEEAGVYEWALDGNQLALTEVEDSCELRSYVLSTAPFNRE
jgi:steroid delta-isomerase-like uncharacterized protein